MPKRGRPTKLLDTKSSERIIQLLRAGHYRQTAAEAVGLTLNRVSQWMKLGLEQPESLYGDFRKRVIEAETEAHEESLRIIRESAHNDPKQAQWWLARKYPEMWADKTRIQHEGVKGGEPIVIQKIDVKALKDTSTVVDEDAED